MTDHDRRVYQCAVDAPIEVLSGELEADGMITREVFDQVPPKVVYDIAVEERDRLEEVVQPLCACGLHWVEKTGARVLALAS